jgi:hypothetical protein
MITREGIEERFIEAGYTVEEKTETYTKLSQPPLKKDGVLVFDTFLQVGWNNGFQLEYSGMKE